MNLYRSNTSSDSANHLVEINHQVKANAERTITDNTYFATSIADSITSGSFATDADLLAYLQRQKNVWNADSIRVYTDGGLCYDQNGIAANRDDGSKFAYRAVRDGSVSNVTGSQIEYGVSVNTTLKVQGQRVVAISVVRDMGSFIDSMDFQSFNGQGYIYLTQKNGIKVSQSTSNDTPVIFNVTSLFENGTMTNLSHPGITLEQEMSDSAEAVFLYTDASGTTRYAVMTPLQAMDETWYLFYLVPEATVDQTLNGFVGYVQWQAALVMIAFLALLLVFYFIYRHRVKRYNTDLRERERLFDLLVSETDTAFCLISEKCEDPLYLSSNAKQVLGLTGLKIKMDSNSVHLYDPGNSNCIVLNHLNKSLEKWDGSDEFSSDFIPCDSSESPRYVRVKLYPTRERTDEYIGIAQDVTEERRRENMLRSALTMADSANHAKTEFLSNMSHDIRTPMNAIVNMTRFAQGSVNDPKKTYEYLDVIQRSSDHLLQLINDVLDMSRIESGKLTFSEEAFDLPDVLERTCGIIAPLCEGKGQTFTYDWSSIQHQRIKGDALRLDQVLINLLNNAMKFTPEQGKINLEVIETHSLRPNIASYRFVVSDTGSGMDEETIGRIFEPFTRGDVEEVRSVEGSGLGLSITKNLIEGMSGSIDVDSTLGAGSTFTVELFFPIETDANETRDNEAEKEKLYENARFDGLHALVAEDNLINQAIARTMIESWGFIVDAADNGRQAVDMFAEKTDPPYAIVFMDVQMPLMNGYQATTAIRALQRPDARRVPIIAMTANVFSEDVDRARQAGMNAHVGKPIDPDVLKLETAKLLLKGGTND